MFFYKCAAANIIQKLNCVNCKCHDDVLNVRKKVGNKTRMARNNNFFQDK